MGFARLAQEGETRSLASGGRERRVAQAPPAAASRHEAGARTGQVGQDRTVDRQHDRAVRNPQLEVSAVRAGAVATRALLAIARPLVGMIVKIQQGMDIRVHDEKHVTAATTVAAVWAAERFELLPVNRGHTVAAVPSDEMQHDAIDEARHALPPPQGH